MPTKLDETNFRSPCLSHYVDLWKYQLNRLRTADVMKMFVSFPLSSPCLLLLLFPLLHLLLLLIIIQPILVKIGTTR